MLLVNIMLPSLKKDRSAKKTISIYFFLREHIFPLDFIGDLKPTTLPFWHMRKWDVFVSNLRRVSR